MDQTCSGITAGVWRSRRQYARPIVRRRFATSGDRQVRDLADACEPIVGLAMTSIQFRQSHALHLPSHIPKGRMVLSMSRRLIRATRRRPRILCHVVHHFGITTAWEGRSAHSPQDHRQAVVTRALEALRALPYDIDVKVCGRPDAALIPIDIDCSAVTDPRHFAFAAIETLAAKCDDYDYVLCSEDDILLTPDVIARMMRFEQTAEVNEILLPNRLESAGVGLTYCVDFLAFPGWSGLHREFDGLRLDIALNPHSGLAFLSRRQLDYAKPRVDLARRDLVFGGYTASAFANLHRPFVLWRTRNDEAAHHVMHLDSWKPDVRRFSLPGNTLRRVPEDGLGYIDTITLDGLICTIAGWAMGADGSRSPAHLISIGDYPVTSAHVVSTSRPDVCEAYGGVDKACGFRVAFSLLDVEASRLAADTITVDANPVRLTATWPKALAVHATEHAPTVPEAPLMPRLLTERIRALLGSARCYLEYGTGGTTVLAAQLGVPVSYCVESDASWLSAVAHKANRVRSQGQLHLRHADIGPVDAWGYPTAQPHSTAAGDYALDVWRQLQADGASPDIVLIDGRFRVSCFLASLLHARPGTRILFDDYLDRVFYRAVEQIIPPATFHDRGAEFVVPDDLPRDRTWNLLARHVGDAR